MFAKRTIASCLLMASLERTFSFGSSTVPGLETGAPEDFGGSILNNISTKMTMLLVFASLLGLSHQNMRTLHKQVAS